MWSLDQINQHKKSCEKLSKIINLAFLALQKNNNLSEYEIQEFILAKFKEFGLKTNNQKPIVAFGASAADPHYTPAIQNSQKLAKNNFIMIDIWAKENNPRSPFADITWMGYFGKISAEEEKIYNLVIKARGAGVKFIQKNLAQKIMPAGQAIDNAVRAVIAKAGLGENFIHSTGHSIGTASPHGIYQRINKKNKNSLKFNLGYTIEPGIYLKNRFGIRSEIDFYINKKFELIITAPRQKNLIAIN